MNKALVICTLLLSLLTGCAAAPTSPAQSPSPSPSPATEPIAAAIVDGNVISSEEYENFVTYCASLYAMSGFDVTSDPQALSTLRGSAMNMLIDKELMLGKANALGLSELHKDERAALDENYDSVIAELLAPFVETATIEQANDSSVDIQARANTRLDEELTLRGMSREKLRQDLYDDYIISNKLYGHITAEIDSGDVDTESWYNAELEAQRMAVEADPTAYEAFLNDDLALFVPEGYIFCRYLFVAAELRDDAQQQLATLQASAEELAGQIQTLISEDLEKNTAEIEALNLKLSAIKAEAAAFMDSQREPARRKAEALAGQLDAGSSFDSLIKSEGLSDQHGDIYAIGKGSDYPEVFRDAALALLTDGANSGAVELEDGFCVIERTGAPTPGAVALDTASELCAAKALEASRADAWTGAIESWYKTAEIEIIAVA